MARAKVAKQPLPAPGAMVVVRDEEWLVRSVRPSSQDRFAVHVTGTSELVRGKDAIFLSDLDRIEELKPEETELVLDDTPRYRKSRLYLDSLLRRSPPTDDAIHAGHRAAIRQTPYQLQPAAKALKQLRPRILMADGVGQFRLWTRTGTGSRHKTNVVFRRHLSQLVWNQNRTGSTGLQV
jgi:hypothetical protein